MFVLFSAWLELVGSTGRIAHNTYVKCVLTQE